MPKPSVRSAKYFMLAFLILFFLGGRPVEFGQEKEIFHGFSIPKPVIRIGLEVNLEEALIGSSSGMTVYEVSGQYSLLAEDVREVRVIGQKEKLSEKFTIQVGLAREKKEAEKQAGVVRSKISKSVFVHEHAEENTKGKFYSVEVGDFQTRGEALSFIKDLNQAGLSDVWVREEEVTGEESRPFLIFIADRIIRLNEKTILYFIPSYSQSLLSFNGRPYRGIFIIKPSRKGLVLINVLNLEDYLKGVVPDELSPQIFGEIEALKAQAVAARTYAVKNRGLNRDLGFDLCDTPRSQVYGGVGSEHPLSNRAVEETKGEAAVYKGELINALYTSTCGGWTENAENVFGGKPQPYLESTECLYEKQREWVLQRNAVFLPIHSGERSVTWEVAVLVGLGIISDRADPSFYRAPASWEETSAWTKKALEILGKKAETPAPEASTPTFPGFGRFLINAFGWRDRADNLMLKSEADFILRGFPKLSQEEKNSLAYLILSGILPQAKEIGSKDRTVMRAEVALALYKILAGYKDYIRTGTFKGYGPDGVEIVQEEEVTKLELPADAFLFWSQDRMSSPTASLSLLGGETCRWVEREGKISVFEVAYAQYTNVLDRKSAYHRWQQRIPREELEKKVNQYYPVGRLVDVEVRRRGESKRVIELSIIGEESQVVVRGLRVRWVLGLRDTLFTVDRVRDENGTIGDFVFSGKGWGHGVGLCQVGAYGMAQQGAGYKEILKKYYRGIKIDKIH